MALIPSFAMLWRYEYHDGHDFMNNEGRIDYPYTNSYLRVHDLTV